MKPGRSLDVLVAEKVMGFESFPEGCGKECNCNLQNGGYWVEPDDLPLYSTDIAAAWKVVDEMFHRKFVLQIHSPYVNVIPGSWKAMFGFKWVDPEKWSDEINNHSADTAPHAICLAALKAIGVDL